jgi:hypothetical protein
MGMSLVMPESPITISVTNHAVNRYLSRIHRAPRAFLPGDRAYEAIRAKIHNLVENGIRAGASVIKNNGAVFRTARFIGHNGAQIVRVVTVTKT